MSFQFWEPQIGKIICLVFVVALRIIRCEKGPIPILPRSSKPGIGQFNISGAAAHATKTNDSETTGSFFGELRLARRLQANQDPKTVGAAALATRKHRNTAEQCSQRDATAAGHRCLVQSVTTGVPLRLSKHHLTSSDRISNWDKFAGSDWVQKMPVDAR